MRTHTHALDCVIDPAMPAVIRPMRWPELRANPLHTGRTAIHGDERRLLAAAIAQQLDQDTSMPYEFSPNAPRDAFGFLANENVWGEPADRRLSTADRQRLIPSIAKTLGLSQQMVFANVGLIAYRDGVSEDAALLTMAEYAATYDQRGADEATSPCHVSTPADNCREMASSASA